jgi:hypothetical protein
VSVETDRVILTIVSTIQTCIEVVRRKIRESIHQGMISAPSKKKKINEFESLGRIRIKRKSTTTA